MIREKKMYVVLTFYTTTAAMEMEKKCESMGIPGRLIPVPRQISAGCGMAWRILTGDYQIFKEKIRQMNIQFQNITEIAL